MITVPLPAPAYKWRVAGPAEIQRRAAQRRVEMTSLPEACWCPRPARSRRTSHCGGREGCGSLTRRGSGINREESADGGPNRLAIGSGRAPDEDARVDGVPRHSRHAVAVRAGVCAADREERPEEPAAVRGPPAAGRRSLPGQEVVDAERSVRDACQQVALLAGVHVQGVDGPAVRPRKLAVAAEAQPRRPARGRKALSTGAAQEASGHLAQEAKGGGLAQAWRR